MKYHAVIKRDVEIHMTQQDGHGAVSWKSYRQHVQFDHIKKKICKCIENLKATPKPKHFSDVGQVFIFTSKIFLLVSLLTKIIDNFFLFFYWVFSSFTFPMLSQKSPIRSPPLPYPLIPIFFLALAFPCTGAYTVCMSNGPLFAVMAD